MQVHGTTGLHLGQEQSVGLAGTWQTRSTDCDCPCAFLLWTFASLLKSAEAVTTRRVASSTVSSRRRLRWFKVDLVEQKLVVSLDDLGLSAGLAHRGKAPFTKHRKVKTIPLTSKHTHFWHSAALFALTSWTTPQMAVAPRFASRISEENTAYHRLPSFARPMNSTPVIGVLTHEAARPPSEDPMQIARKPGHRGSCGALILMPNLQLPLLPQKGRGGWRAGPVGRLG
jgi:hypothetical protein